MSMIEQEGIQIETRAVDHQANTMVVAISGYVDQANCHLLQKTINTCLEDEYVNLVFDLQGLVYMSSAGWGVLIGEIKRFRESVGDIKLANMGPEIYEIYQMLEFYHILSEYPSVDEALKSFAKGDSGPAPSAPRKGRNPRESGGGASPNGPEKRQAGTDGKETPSDEADPSAEAPDGDSGGEDRTEVVSDEQISINIEDILADEGIARTSGAPEDHTSYVEFDLDRYSREMNIRNMPIPDKVRAIVGANPELGAWQIKKMLQQEEYGGVKIGYFKLRGLLKTLDLNTKEKRFRYFRSA